ncbi:hypothetical protein LF1_33100 [Rubripirellula obstinata]|uniref:Uncharacterized protein n=1 Tax=Rubripirellula obstinata TaxID=406547 RepID=A0A5B1CLV6_9BACT|nr:hypothetical protein LF1_33100 [Rubripirellula obstinata]
MIKNLLSYSSKSMNGLEKSVDDGLTVGRSMLPANSSVLLTSHKQFSLLVVVSRDDVSGNGG